MDLYTMPIRKTKRLPAERLARIARTLLDAAPLCAIATVSATGRAYVNTAYRSDRQAELGADGSVRVRPSAIARDQL